MFGEFRRLPMSSREIRGVSASLESFEEKKLRLEVSTLSLCSEMRLLWLNSVFGVTLMGVTFMGSAVTFMGNCDIYGKRYDIYGEL